MKFFRVLTAALAFVLAGSPATGAGSFTLSGKLESSRPVIIKGTIVEVIFHVRAEGISYPGICRSAGCISALDLAGEEVAVAGTLSRDERSGGIVLIAQTIEPAEGE